MPDVPSIVVFIALELVFAAAIAAPPLFFAARRWYRRRQSRTGATAR